LALKRDLYAAEKRLSTPTNLLTDQTIQDGSIGASDPLHDRLRCARCEVESLKETARLLETSRKSISETVLAIRDRIESSRSLATGWAHATLPEQRLLFDLWVDHVIINVERV